MGKKRGGNSRRRQPRNALIPETHYQQTITDWATLNGWKWAHFHDSRRQVSEDEFVGDQDAKGFPDLCLTRPPDVIFVEVKSDTGHLEPDQRAWGDDLSLCPGVEYYLSYPKDWPVIEERLGRPRSSALALLIRRVLSFGRS